MKGKEKRGCTTYKWSTTPPPPHHIPSRNIIPYLSGHVGIAKVTMEAEAFDLFFDDKIIETILVHTNQEIAKQKINYVPGTSYVKDIDILELKAYIGLLFLTAVKKDNTVSSPFLWGTCGSEVYSAIMSNECLKFFTNCLCFDECMTRDIRKALDEFAPIRDIWDKFMKNCSDMYCPSVNCTIDEQLVGFRGRCKFRIYIPSKPDKYGLKLVLLCNSYNRYVVPGMPYLGKVTPNGNSPLAEYLVENLTKPVHGMNINITSDNWFTPVPLANKMLTKHKLTMVGTMCKNKVEIPQDTLLTKNQPV